MSAPPISALMIFAGCQSKSRSRDARAVAARQRKIVARLEHGPTESITLRIARELLQEMECGQRLHVADRNRLREQLEP